MDEEGAPPALAPRKPWSKWTADTEQAFLYALRLTGQTSKAAAEIGRSKNTAFSRRRTHPEFARRWDEAVAAQQSEWAAAQRARLARAKGDPIDDGCGGGRLTPYRERPGGWDARKRGRFLRALRRTKRVSDACAAAGMSESSAYYLRSQSPRFAAAWEKALAEGAPPSVMSAVLERAVEGWDDPVFYGGKLVGHRKRFSEGLLRDLVRPELGRGTGGGTGGGRGVARAPQPEPPLRSTEAELTEAILKKLALLDARERRKADAEWDRWQLCWTDPVAGARVEEADEDEDEEDWGED